MAALKIFFKTPNKSPIQNHIGTSNNKFIVLTKHIGQFSDIYVDLNFRKYI